ncbi:MAG: hypothetical protein E6J78_10345 [Deltaproteobacteria bacterium]|nr:MAG: hypothetical protein E6J78_10345 [Deltaproteobacteria bacterium]
MLRRFSLSVLAVVALALGYSKAALADPPTLSIQQQATLDATGVLVYVVLDCGAGASTATLTVQVGQGNYTGASTAPITSTGARQVVAVQVNGTFQPGAAAASAILECGALAQGLQLGATINISP